MKEIRLLKENEIECRAQSVTEKGCILLIYKDARVDMKILDETFGIDGWQRTHELINGNLFCNIEIWSDEKKCWVKKQDVGTESNTEKEKGEASDSFKRAGFNVGIGRELYTSPFIWIELLKDEVYTKENKWYLQKNIKFSVKEISYNTEKEISNLIIIDNKKAIRYEMNKRTPAQPTQTKTPQRDPDLVVACDDMRRTTTEEEMLKVWSSWKKFQTDTTFVTAKNLQKEKLNIK